jgi:N-acyl-L-homoserine lactone synthetase
MATPSPDNASPMLALADALAQHLLAKAAPLRFALAETDADREAAYRLRYRVGVERGWLRPADCPDGLERDAYDDDALQIAGWDGAEMIATGRIVLPNPARPLPIEAAFGLAIEPRGQVVELGRATVLRARSDPRHGVLRGLLARAWLEARARGFQVWAGLDSPAMVRLYRQLGFQVTVLGPARDYQGEERAPVRYDIPASAPTLTARWGETAPPR